MFIALSILKCYKNTIFVKLTKANLSICLADCTKVELLFLDKTNS